jgi:glutathione synthase/RimK-type ligase-like ATP-grasp enzyme
VNWITVESTQARYAVCASLGLIFCTIDFKNLDSGDPVFFEVNPQGQFLYVEIMTGQKITQSVATALAEIAEAKG